MRISLSWHAGNQGEIHMQRTPSNGVQCESSSALLHFCFLALERTYANGVVEKKTMERGLAGKPVFEIWPGSGTMHFVFL